MRKHEFMSLRPQDVVVLLKIVSCKGSRPPYAKIAEELFLSPSQLHASVKRAQAAHLLHGPELGERVNVSALEEFLVHGLKYVFPPKKGGVARGLPTSYAAEPLSEKIARSDHLIPVWPCAEGVQGYAFAPLYKNAPDAAKRDPELRKLLVLVDALRAGRVRERKLAEQELSNRLGALLDKLR
jgi:hypothetical protein